MRQQLFGMLLCGAVLVMAQPPAAPPPVAAPPAAAAPVASSTVTGTISQFNFGPNGEVTGFVIAPNTSVSLPPDWGIQVELLAKVGNQVTVTGAVTPTLSGMQIMDAQALNIAGRTLSSIEPSQPVPYAGSGVIRSLNYGRGGEISGFLLDNGILALTPPMGTSNISVVKPGANISVSGFAHPTPAGRTVVDVQSITANGQTITMTAAPPNGPGPGVGPGPGPGVGPAPGPGRGPRAEIGPPAGPPPPPPPNGGPIAPPPAPPKD
jgi:hypothetical protein